MPKYNLENKKKKKKINPYLRANELRRGLGATGEPRMGKPKTEAERKATHYALHGTTRLPVRGTGLKKRKKKGIKIY